MSEHGCRRPPQRKVFRTWNTPLAEQPMMGGMRWAFRFIGREPSIPVTYLDSLQEPPLPGVPAWDAIAE
jgi:hypothetical protein